MQAELVTYDIKIITRNKNAIAGCIQKEVTVEYTCRMGRHGPAKILLTLSTGAPLQDSQGVLRKKFHNDDRGIMWNI